MLEIKNIHTYYGLCHALFDVSLTVKPGEVVCLLGRNGAGKSTVMKSVMGIAPPKKGAVVFKGKNITDLEPYKTARMGIGYVPDDRRVFADLTVEENLEISQRASNQKKEWNTGAVYDFFPPLKKIHSRKAGFLSGGEQQMLAIGRALVTNPDFLLLDEPTEGLAPMIVEMLARQIKSLKENGATVLLAEQNLNVALSLSDRGYIIDNGEIKGQGTIEELKENHDIKRKYLGVSSRRRRDNHETHPSD